MSLKFKILIITLVNITIGSTVPWNGRILGGIETSIRNIPHQVSVQYQNVHICGGAIISRRFILTAAHCVKDYQNAKFYAARVGSPYHNHEGFLYRVDKILPHEVYNKPFKQNNDIALMKLNTTLEYSSSIKSILLSPAVHPGTRPPYKYFVSGWGVTSKESKKLSELLRLTFVNLVDWQTCQSLYGERVPITPNVFCAGLAEGGRDSCQGDSGGGLIEIDSKARVRLLGIISRGFGCGVELKPGIYTKVSVYKHWIEQSAMKLMKE